MDPGQASGYFLQLFMKPKRVLDVLLPGRDRACSKPRAGSRLEDNRTNSNPALELTRQPQPPFHPITHGQPPAS